MDRGAWQATVHGVARAGRDLPTKERERESHFLKFWGESTAAGAAAKSLQSCPTLCEPIDGSPPGSPIPGILQERTLEWGAISFSGESTIYYIKLKIYLYDNSNIFFHLETTSLTQYTHNIFKYQNPINVTVLHECVFKTKCFYCIKYVCVNKG